jgi:hypothetical protein
MRNQIIKLLNQWRAEKEFLLYKVPVTPADIERVQVLAECIFELEMILENKNAR